MPFPSCEARAAPRKPSRRSPRMAIPPTHYPASRAASVVESCINYQQGSPHKVFLVQTVKQASLQVSRAEGGGGTCYRSPHRRGSQLHLLLTPHTPCPFWASRLAVSLEELAFLGLGYTPVSGDSPGAVCCFYGKAETLIVFMGPATRKSVNVLSWGSFSPFPK